jgi:hypothetical protein
MKQQPLEVESIESWIPGEPDDALVLAASWEERCLGVASKLAVSYSAQHVLMTVYDGESSLRKKHIAKLSEVLASRGELHQVPARHANPIKNVRDIVRIIRSSVGNRSPRLTVDISTFTKKHLLQLLQGFDLADMLNQCQFLYTEPTNYHTADDEPISQGISSVKAIETFAGYNTPSRDSLLVIFLGYEGRRALALWEHLEPNVTIAVIPDPPYHPDWESRTETQNHFLLSCLRPGQVFKTHSLIPKESEEFLTRLFVDPQLGAERYNYRIAPLGTKAQLLGIYRFWRKHLGCATLMYARPFRYREENATFPFGRTWVIDRSENWDN